MWWPLTFGLIYFLFRVLGLFGTCISIPRCNSIRTVEYRSPPPIFAFVSFTWKWSLLARPMPLTQLPVIYCLVGWPFICLFCNEVPTYKTRLKCYWASMSFFRERRESTLRSTRGSSSRCLVSHAWWTLSQNCWICAPSYGSHYTKANEA